MSGLSYNAGLPGTLGQRWTTWSASAERRRSAGQRLAIYAEDHLGLVEGMIEKALGNGPIARDVKQFATRSPNLFRAVADCVAVAYRSGCTRSLRDASPEVARAFADVVDESGITRRAANINARAWCGGPVFVAPYLSSRGAVALDIIGSDRIDAEMRGEDVQRVLWQLPRAQGGSYVLLDESGWYYYDRTGEPTGGDVTHAVGRCPAVPFVAYDGGDDLWAASAHGALADATILCGYKAAYGLYARQVGAFPLVTIFSDSDKAPGGQVMGHPIRPLHLSIESRVQVDEGRVIPAKDYLDEISAIITMAVSAAGLPPGSVTLIASNNDWGSLAVSAEGSRLAAHRDRQVPFLVNSERSLWPIVCDIVRGSTHRHARTLPPGDEVRDMLRVTFPELASPEEQLKRIEAMKAGLPFGLSSPLDVELAARPELTRDEVDERQKANLASYIERIKPLVEHNIPGQAPAADGHQTTAQLQGRQGGLASGETRAANATQENVTP